MNMHPLIERYGLEDLTIREKRLLSLELYRSILAEHPSSTPDESEWINDRIDDLESLLDEHDCVIVQTDEDAQ